MSLKVVVTTLLLCCAICTAAENIYDGYKIYDVNAKNLFEKGVLLRLSANEDYDFFDLPKLLGKPARVMIKPEHQYDFEAVLSKFSIDYNVMNHNVGESIEEERKQNEQISRSVLGDVIDSSALFEKFLRFSEIDAYIEKLENDYPNRVFLKTVGKSYESRPMKTIMITNGDNRKDKKIIFVDAGIHAREWIAPAAAVYIIHQLVENFSDNSHLLKDYNWHILPVANPDGYEYTFLKSRMWRKTRKPVSALCFGTDGNRNFDFHWGEVGASSYACTETFKGVTAFSEPETKVMRDLMLSFSGFGKMYLTLHSYGNYLLYPWGYTSDLPENVKDLDEVANAGADAIRAATGTEYSVGSSTNVLYAAAGGSDDYALAKANFPISITMELPGGGSGFDPSPSQIKPFVSETWIGIKAMAEKVIEKY